MPKAVWTAGKASTAVAGSTLPRISFHSLSSVTGHREVYNCESLPCNLLPWVCSGVISAVSPRSGGLKPNSKKRLGKPGSHLESEQSPPTKSQSQSPQASLRRLQCCARHVSGGTPRPSSFVTVSSVASSLVLSRRKGNANLSPRRRLLTCSPPPPADMGDGRSRQTSDIRRTCPRRPIAALLASELLVVGLGGYPTLPTRAGQRVGSSPQ